MILTLHKDDIDKVVASVTINGASGSDRLARLILVFPNRKLMFDGVFNGNNVTVEVPRLMDVDETSGTAVLEIIADRAYFEAWKNEFELVYKKSVSVDEVGIERQQEIVVSVDAVELTQEEAVVEEQPVEEEQREYTLEEDFFCEKATKRNKQIVAKILNEVREIELEENTEFSDDVKQWAESIFRDISIDEARLAMSVMESKISK